MTHRYTLAFSFLFAMLSAALLPAQCPITVSAGEDIYLCAPTSPTQLDGSIDGDYLNFFWTPTAGMTGANTLNPTVSVSTTTNYVLTARAADLSNNLISNGDFEAGNADFYSDYFYSPGNLVPEGYYDVLDNPQDDHPGFAPCDDHTSGSGNMMVINGAGTPNQNVWCQTVTVTPNTQYVFSAWVTSVVAASPALLQFSINGAPLGGVFSAPGGTCNWVNFFQLWNSGANGSATICLVNQNTTLGGNDFALDDIVFAPTCLVRDTVTVHVVNITAAASPALFFIPCDGANITLSGAGSSTGANITYGWDTPNGNIVSGGNTLLPVVNAAGTYTLTVTYNNGFTVCEKTATVTVAESPNPLSAWITPPAPLGCGSATVTIIGNSNQPGFSSWQWTAGPGGNIVSGANSKNVVVNQPGTYTLLVTNTNTGCTATAEVTVTSATNPPTAIATATGTITCIQATTPLSGAGSTTGANITYAWTTSNGVITAGQNNINATAGAGGTYVIAVTNTSNNCTAYDTVTVAANTAPPVISIQPPGLLDCDTDTLTISANATPTNATAAWTASGGGNIASGQNTLNPQVTATGTYTLSATNPANGCTAITSTTVASNFTPPVAIVSPADSITCQQSSVTLSGNGSSAGANFSYNWTTTPGGNIVSGQNTLLPVVNAAGTYTLLVTNTTNACTAAASVPVAADTNIVVAIATAPDSLTCAIDTVTLNTTGSSSGSSFTYLWTSAGGGNITGGANSPNPTANAPGTYQLLLTNTANGCSATDLAIIVQNIAQPNIQIAQPDTLTCANPSQTIQAQNLSLPGNFNYSWIAASGGNIVSGNDTLNPVVNAAGVYTLTTTNLVTGCTAADTVAVSIEVGTPVAVAAAPGPLTCIQPTQILNTTGSSTGANFTYQWTSAGGGNIVSGATTPAPTVNQPGNYNLLITNTANGCTATTSVVLFKDTMPPDAVITPPPVLTCILPQFTLLGDGTGDATWSTVGGNIVSGGDEFGNCLIDTPGVYILTSVNTVNGCIAADTVQVTANQQIPPVTILPPGELTCVQTAVTLNIAGGDPNFGYQWQTPDGQFVSGQTTPSPVVNAPGTYTLLVTDLANGCTVQPNIVIVQDTAAPQANIAQPYTLTCNFTQFELEGSGTGNAAWTTTGGNIISGQNQFHALIDAPGLYTLTALDPSNGCTATVSVAVLEDIVSPLAEAGTDDTLSCNVNSLTLNSSGTGSAFLTFEWTASNGGNIVSGADSLNPVVDAPGTYSLLVVNTANGCTATDVVQILEDVNTPQANAGLPATLTCAVQQTTLNATGSTGPNFTYNWTASNGGNILSGQNTLSPLVNEPGTYTLTVNNLDNGCVADSQVVVNENVAPPPVGVAPPGTLTCAITSLNLPGMPTSGNYTWSWTSAGGGNIVAGASSPTPLIDQPGSYTLVVIDQQNGCSATAFSIVSEDVAAPVIAIAAPGTLTCAITSRPLSGQVSQPTAGFAADWATAGGHFVSGQNTLNPMVDQPGTYILTVENLQNGCTTAAQTVVSQNIVPPVAQAAAPDAITCADSVVGVSGAGSSAGPGFAYAWSGGTITGGQNTLTPTVSAAGAYTLTVTDQTNGCTATATATVGSNTTPPSVAIAAPAALTCVQNTVTLNGGGSSSGASAWTTTGGHFVSGQNTLNPVVDQPGTYFLAITNLQNGCSTTAQTLVLQNTTPPGAEAGAAPELHCKQPEAILNGSSPTAGNMIFAWATANGHFTGGANTPAPTVDAPGNYSLTVTNPVNGCTSADAVTVTEVPPPAFTPELMQPDCHDTKGAVDLGAVTGGSAPFKYSKDGGQTFQNQPFFNNLPPGLYDLVLRDANGCTAVANAELEQPFLPTVTLPEFISLQLGDLVYLEPALNLSISDIVSWQWSPAEGLSCTDCPSPLAIPLRPTIYTLKIIDLNGCEAQAKVQLRVDRRRYLYAPNIFSPDGDGVNDVFTLYGRAVTEIRSLQVFDRWGAEIFLVEHLQANDELRGWDGTFRGAALNPAVFVWQAVVEFVDGEVGVFSGDVTLER